MHVLLCLLVICVSSHFATASWTQSHRNLITKIHNDYRNGIKEACDMTDLVYDKKIEVRAKAWAKRCKFEHQYKEFGENLAIITKYGKESDRITEMAKLWYDEVKDFTYGIGSCGAACHYTQMVWAKTRKLGCYAADCSGEYLLVCFYTPPGNMQGEEPYQKVCNGKKSNKNSNSKPVITNNNNNNNNKQPKKTNQNNNVVNNKDFDSWNTNFGGDTDWNSWPEEMNNNGWEVQKNTGTNGKNGKWTVWTAKKTYRYKK